MPWKLRMSQVIICIFCIQFMFDLVQIGFICHFLCPVNKSALFIHSITWLQPQIHIYLNLHTCLLWKKNLFVSCHPSTQTRDYWVETDYVVCLKMYACRRWRINCNSVPFIRVTHNLPKLTKFCLSQKYWNHKNNFSFIFRIASLFHVWKLDILTFLFPNGVP